MLRTNWRDVLEVGTPSAFWPASGRHSDGSPVTRLVVRESPPEAPKPRLLDRVREAIRARHYTTKYWGTGISPRP